MTTTRIAVICVLACACGRHLNPEFCATHPGNEDCVPVDGMTIDGGPCTTDMDCKNPLPVCDTAAGMCVMCTPTKNVCHNPTPVCDMTDMCVPPQCNSNVVLPDGTCADGANVIYVQPGGDTGGTCMQNDPCSLSEGLNHLSPRNIIHLADGSYPGPHTFDSQNVTAIVFGLHATLSGGTPVVTIPAGSKVDLDYVTVSNGNGGVSCATGATLGIHGASIRNNQMDYGVTSACALTIDAASVFGNTSGALDVTGGTFDVRNSALFNNGSSNLRSSPVLLDGGTGSFAFNTVTHNTTKSGGGPPASGVECNVGKPAPGNIVVGNTGSNQTAGNCSFATSRTSGTAAEVMWVGFPPATAADLHLTAGSPARNVAGLDCSMNPTDIDAEPRPMGGLCDQGADEYKE
jgi:hypothetical protein